MSTDNPINALNASKLLDMSPSLSADEQQTITTLSDLLLIEDIEGIDYPNMTIKKLVDGRGLACPMPLLKTKVALRDMVAGESLYVIATDPNSQADITAFCQQSQKLETPNSLSLTLSEATAIPAQHEAATLAKTSFDTIYHFIITKTDSN